LRAVYLWEKVGAFDVIAFGTEIAVAKVVMEDGENWKTAESSPMSSAFRRRKIFVRKRTRV